MLVKASIAAAALICVVLSLSSIDFRQLYNGMYPINGLRRDVLNLCHEAEPTFVRAISASRASCYDAMPDPVERAIGWVRTSSRLAAMKRPPSGAELAERLLDEAATQRRFDLLRPHWFTGYAACGDPAEGLAAPALATMDDPLAPHRLAPDPPAPDPLAQDALAEDRLARPISGGEDRALAALGLAPRDARAGSAREPGLPVLPLGTAAGFGRPDPSPMLAPDLGDSSALSLAPPAAAPGCKRPA